MFNAVKLLSRFAEIVRGEFVKYNWTAAATVAAGYLGAEATKDAAAATRGAAGEVQFSPYDVTTGIGTGAFGPGNQAAGALSPEYQAIAQALQGQAGQQLGVDPQAAVGLGQQATQAGAGFLGQLQTFDPFEAAETQFGRLESILAPGRERARQELEGRLLRQGRLGSTGGSLQEQGFQRAIEEQRTANLVNAFQQAQQTQAQQAQLGTSLGAFGVELPQRQGLQALQADIGLQQIPLQQLELGGAFGGREMQAGAGRADLLAQAGQFQPSFMTGLASGALQGAFSGGGGFQTGGGGTGMWSPGGGTATFQPAGTY